MYVSYGFTYVIGSNVYGSISNSRSRRYSNVTFVLFLVNGVSLMTELESLYDELNIMMEEFPIFDRETLGLELYTAAAAERRSIIKKINKLEENET